jgi:hypothetical protein
MSSAVEVPERLIVEKPIEAIDKIIEALPAIKNEKRVFAMVGKGGRAIASHLNIRVLTGTDIFDLLLSQVKSQSEQEFLAASLLRLFAAQPDLFNNDKLRIKTVQLFDQTLQQDVYPQLGLSEKKQNYEKMQKLQEVVPSAEIRIRSVIDTLGSISTVRDFRHQFMREFNKPLVRRLIRPFMPKNLAETRLDQIFSVVEAYQRGSGPTISGAYLEAQEVLGTFVDDAEDHGGLYTKRYLAEVGKRLLLAVREHYEASPAFQPVRLQVKAASKKYPLHHVGSTIDLRIMVQNFGPGQAYDTELIVEDTTEDIKLQKIEQYLGEISQGALLIELPAEILQNSRGSIIEGSIAWQNPNGTRVTAPFTLEFLGQRTDVDWDSLRRDDPYNLEPVSTEAELVGRGEILADLIRQATGARVGSSIIHGQKRVGKTSIAQTLKSHLEALGNCDYLVINLESGDYVDRSPEITVRNLGKALVDQVRYSYPPLSTLEAPTFEGSLAPFSIFLTNAIRLVPELKILFILDEFDELPPDLFQHSTLSDAFFLPIRSISNKTAFGFILIGSERIELVMNAQGEKLNKFQTVAVTYFDRQNQWSDFVELVRRPVQDRIDISDEALLVLYEETAGNPYFTKLACAELFKHMINKRDSFVTEREVGHAIESVVSTLSSNSFQHFWEDGIFHAGDRARDISVNRRKVLIALGETLRRGRELTEAAIIATAEQYDLDQGSVKVELRDFERRQILTKQANVYRCKVPLFEKWLKERGISEVLTSIDAADYILQSQKRKEELYVKPAEVMKVLEHWGLYKSHQITTDHLRAWLEQFEDIEEQRLMFTLVKSLRFFKEDFVRERMRVANGIVMRDMRINARSRRLREVIVSYLDGAAKSGAHYARLYARENNVLLGNVVEVSALRERIEQTPEAQALVFVDDFIGTGTTAVEGVRRLHAVCGSLLIEKQLRVFLVAVTGFEVARERIEIEAERLELPLTVHVCEPLEDTARCFHSENQIFGNEATREKAKAVAKRYGLKLANKHPLGHEDSQALLTFSDACPNNTLPILWSSANGWLPLFER